MPANLYKRGSTWWCRFKVNGVEYRRSLRTTSRAEALRRLAAEREQVAHVRYHGEARVTWKMAVEEWGAVASQSISSSTMKRYLVSMRAVRPILESLYLDEITQRTIAKIANRKGVSNATLRRDLTAVSAVLRYARGQH